MLSRVHWLLHDLSTDFKRDFNLYFDYAYHTYVFYNNYGYRSPRIKEFFSIVRTSKRCFRLFYFNDYHGINMYRSFNNYRKCADFMMMLHMNYSSDISNKHDTWIEKRVVPP